MNDRRFSSPAERTRNIFLIGGASSIALVFIVRAILSFWAFLALWFLIMVAGTVIGLRRFKAMDDPDQKRPRVGSMWECWPPVDAPTITERRAYLIKAGRFYAVAFGHGEIIVSPKIDSKRAAVRWVHAYENGAEVEIAHRLGFDEIEEVVVRVGSAVEVEAKDTTYLFDGWFNRFDGEHHQQVQTVVECQGLALIEESPTMARFVRVADGAPVAARVPASTGLLAKKVNGRTVVSLGGGANMFDVHAANTSGRHG